MHPANDSTAISALLVAPPSTINAATLGTANESFTIDYSDTGSGIDVSTLGPANVQVTGGGTTLPTNASVSGDEVTYTFSPPSGNWTTSPQGVYSIALVDGSVKDLDGNSIAGNANFATFDVDTVAPTAMLATVPLNATSGNSQTNTATFTVDYSDQGSGIDPTTFGTGNVTVSGGAKISAASIDGNDVTYTIMAPAATWAASPQGTYTVGLTSQVRDEAGNTIAANANLTSFAVETVLPGVTVSNAPAQANPTSTSPVLFSATFSEPVTDFNAADVVLGGSAPGILSASVSGSGASYAISVSGMTGPGTVTAAVAAGTVHDAYGNTNTASTNTSDGISYDPNIQLAGGQLSIHGSGTDDFVSIYFSDPSDFVVSLGGFSESFSTAQAHEIEIDGGTGQDTAVIWGSMGTISGQLGAGGGTITGANFRLDVQETFAVYVYADNSSSITLAPAAGSAVVATPGYSYEGLQGQFFDLVSGFGQVTTDGSSGSEAPGIAAYFYSAPGATLSAAPASSTLVTSGSTITVNDYPVVYAFGSSTGGDQARFGFGGSTGGGALVATPTYAYISGVTETYNFFDEAVGFHNVLATGGSGDVAYLYDSAGADHLAAAGGAAGVAGSGYQNVATGFQTIYATGAGHGDVAQFDRGNGHQNSLSTDGATTTLAGPYGATVAAGFAGTTQLNSNESTSDPNEALDFVLTTLAADEG